MRVALKLIKRTSKVRGGEEVITVNVLKYISVAMQAREINHKDNL